MRLGKTTHFVVLDAQGGVGGDEPYLEATPCYSLQGALAHIATEVTVNNQDIDDIHLYEVKSIPFSVRTQAFADKMLPIPKLKKRKGKKS